MKPTALVVEDTEDLALVFHSALEKAGYEVENIYDGDIALERLAVLNPWLVVLDLHLPGASGKTILKYIRSQARLEKVKVILATADSAWADELQEDANLSLLKPISYTQLRDLASRLLPQD